MISKKQLRKYLLQLSNEELANEVEKLFQKFKPVQEYYSLELGGDSSALLNNYKKKLEKVFSVKGNFINPSMAEANKIIKEFSKVSIHAVDTIDLMLYKIELSKSLFEEFGQDGLDSVANSFGSTYAKIIALIHENQLEDYFRKRCNEIEDYADEYCLINRKLED